MKDLELTDFEKGYLTAWYYSIVINTYGYEGVDDSIYNGETDWHGLIIDERAFDIAITYDEDKDALIGVAYGCVKNKSEWLETDTSAGWFIGSE